LRVSAPFVVVSRHSRQRHVGNFKQMLRDA
jgi:hypothetical protein